MVIAVTPSLHLFCQAIAGDPPRWHFVLESLDGTTRLDVSDAETEFDGEQLELLALVRGLEAVWQPSRLIIESPSRYVRQGLESGLADWRRQNWCWERFGQLVPIKHADLWQRVDAALRFHELDVARRELVLGCRSETTGPFQSDQDENLWSPGRVCTHVGWEAEQEYQAEPDLAHSA